MVGVGVALTWAAAQGPPPVHLRWAWGAWGLLVSLFGGLLLLLCAPGRLGGFRLHSGLHLLLFLHLSDVLGSKLGTLFFGWGLGKLLQGLSLSPRGVEPVPDEIHVSHHHLQPPL